AALAGRSYAGSERALRAQLGRIFAHAEGSGLPRPEPSKPSRRLRGILSPHIDFHRGGPVYTWSYRELIERSEADTFVILGVAHQHCRNRFALTTKDFGTPLGIAPTDQDYVGRIAALAGHDLFEDELAHRQEHSIEFQVVFLQYLLGGRRDFSIVPILVGSFHDLMVSGTDPIATDEVRRFIEALRAAEATSGKRVVYIGGVDLCHVGPEFGDPDHLNVATLDKVRAFDEEMLDHASANNPSGWFGKAAGIGN
ncbi:AmmeMemoRadiSam system protein B, partial [Singulisphaera rosea]